MCEYDKNAVKAAMGAMGIAIREGPEKEVLCGQGELRQRRKGSYKSINLVRLCGNC
jgi:hypothetical protein